MALGKRRDEQQEMWVATTSLPKSQGHVFYRKLNQLLAEADFVSVLKPTIRREVLCRQAVTPSLLRQSPHQMFVAAMRPFEACAHGCREARRMSRVIGMSVSHEYQLEPQRLPLEEALDPVEIPTGINHRGGARRSAP